MFLAPTAVFYCDAVEYIDILSTYAEISSKSLQELKDLFETWCYVSGMDDSTCAAEVRINHMNAQGVHL
jgi:hypothetical protein